MGNTPQLESPLRTSPSHSAIEWPAYEPRWEYALGFIYAHKSCHSWVIHLFYISLASHVSYRVCLMLKMHVFSFTPKKVWAGWWHDSPGILKMRTSLKMHIFIGFCPTSGLFWESGGMAGWQQAPADNHRHGHLSRAGRNENFFLFVFFSQLCSSSFMLSCWIKIFLSTCHPQMHKTLDPNRGLVGRDQAKVWMKSKMVPSTYCPGKWVSNVKVWLLVDLACKKKRKKRKERKKLLHWYFAVLAVT